MRLKYGNKKTVCAAEHKHDSAKEAKRCDYLWPMSKQFGIKDLEIHPRFRLEVNGIKICDYIADFRYKARDIYSGDAVDIVEDVKSKATMTPTYRLKKKLMKACLGIDIRET